MKTIIPAILTNDISDLESKLKKIQGLTDWVQIDIMDGKFVNNLSITLEDISKVDLIESFSLEAHLMVENPETYFPECQEIKIKRVIFHFEPTDNINNVLSEAGKYNFQIGLALNPETSITKIKEYLSKLDLILLMSVEPGLQSQDFISQVLDKIKELKKIAPHIKIEVDGGINLGNIKMVNDAGADYLVVGSGLFKSKNIKEQFKKLKEKINL